MPLPQKGVAYVFYTSLVDALDPDSFVSNPTIAAGDFQVSKDGGAFANLTTLPFVAPAGSISVEIPLSADEMNAAKAVVKMLDVAGGQWLAINTFIDIPTGDELAHT